jgi:integrase
MSPRRRDGKPSREKREAALSDFLIKSLKPQAERYYIYDTKCPGLAVRVEKSGTKSFKVIYRYHGKPKWYHIGDTRLIDLGDGPGDKLGARSLALNVLHRVKVGRKDVNAELKAERSQGTFKDMAERYIAEHASKKLKSWKQSEWLLQTYLFPKLGGLPFTEVTRDDVKKLINKLSDRTPVGATNVKYAGSAVYTWGVKEGLVKDNPFKLIDTKVAAERERVLSESEFPKFWEVFDKLGVQGKVLKLILLLGQRPNETASMRREHIVDGWWLLPGDPKPELSWPGTKNGKNHWVWLPQAALDVIGDAKELMFAGARGGVIDPDATMRTICRDLGITDTVRPHDLRRTMGTTITAMKFGRDAMDRILNHKKKSVTAIYDRHTYASEDKQILEAVCQRMMNLVAGKVDADKVVVPMLRKKSA